MRTIVISFCLIWLFGVRSTVSAQTKERVLCPLEQCVLITDMGDRLEEVKMIPLEQIEGKSIEWITKLLITPTGNFVIMNNQVIACFSAEGKFLFTVGNVCDPEKGCGLLRDVCFDVDGKRLLALNWEGNVECFDLKDGHREEIIRTGGDTLMEFYQIIPARDGGFYLCAPYARDEDRTHLKQGHFLLYQLDKRGREVGRFISRVDFTLDNFLVTQAYDNRYLIRTQGGDNTCYQVKDGKWEKRISIDFGDKGVPPLYIYNLAKGGAVDLQHYFTSDYYKMPVYFSEMAKDFFFTCVGPRAQEYRFLFTSKKDAGVYWQGDRQVVFRFYASDKDYFYAIVEGDIRELDPQTQDPLLCAVMEKVGLRKEMEIPAIVKIKFR